MICVEKAIYIKVSPQVSIIADLIKTLPEREQVQLLEKLIHSNNNQKLTKKYSLPIIKPSRKSQMLQVAFEINKETRSQIAQ